MTLAEIKVKSIVWKSRKVHDVQIDLPPFWVPEARSLLNWFETKGSLRLTGLVFWKSFVQAGYVAN